MISQSNKHFLFYSHLVCVPVTVSTVSVAQCSAVQLWISHIVLYISA